MKTKLLITLSISTLLLFTACGSSSKGTSKTTQIKKKEFILIAQNIDLAQCTLSNTKAGINGAVFGTIAEFFQNIDKDTLVVSAEKDNVGCGKYDRVNDEIECTVFDFDEVIGKSCVAGFDFE